MHAQEVVGVMKEVNTTTVLSLGSEVQGIMIILSLLNFPQKCQFYILSLVNDIVLLVITCHVASYELMQKTSLCLSTKRMAKGKQEVVTSIA